MSTPVSLHLLGQDHIPYRLLILARMIDRETSRQLQAEFGLSLAEWRVLAFIGTSGPSSASEMGAAAEIDRAEISRAVSKLLAADLIERHPDTGNRKRLIIHATEKGADLFIRTRDSRRAFFQSMLRPFSAKEKSELSHHLEAMAKAISS